MEADSKKMESTRLTMELTGTVALGALDDEIGSGQRGPVEQEVRL